MLLNGATEMFVRSVTLQPKVSIERAVLDGFGDVVGLDGFGGLEVRDRAGDFEDSVIGAGADAQLVDGHF